jgi:hypothetical protein
VKNTEEIATFLKMSSFLTILLSILNLPGQGEMEMQEN